MRKILCLFFLLRLLPVINAADLYPRNLAVDIIHYEFALTLSDSTDRIVGRASIRIALKAESDSIAFDLMKMNHTGKGMIVSGVSSGVKNIRWKQTEEKLAVFFDDPGSLSDTIDIIVEYSGIPSDGLIISKNKYLHRTFFSDHWPDRAHCYLPCIDHPYDKSGVDFIITAPDKYKVVANGNLVEESDLPGDMTVTHWSENAPVATKVMAFGAAEFAVQYVGIVKNIPVSSWVYPENRKEGFFDYSKAVKPLEYYSNLIGPYPYGKLADVQSKTMYGGLENAGTIFYSENSVTGLGKVEGLIAHEVAHQWFGNSVSEADWHHVWLSEGFATYMTELYFESLMGEERLKTDMALSRVKVIKFFDMNPKPIIDTTITNLMDLLSVNSYQKGAWVLHMLRNVIGYDLFLKGLRLYYVRFNNSNAFTQDFIKAMEEVSGKDLTGFFRQWLFLAGQPELRIWYEKGKTKGTINICIEQKQKLLFDFNLDIQVKSEALDTVLNIPVKERVTKVMLKSMSDVVLTPDPNVKLLFNKF
jgi:aminopeptidase N